MERMVGRVDLNPAEGWTPAGTDRAEEHHEEEGEGDGDDDEKEQHFHVLAVDDSLIDRKFLERLLTVSSNYQVTCVDSGDKALQYLGLQDCIEEEEEDDNEHARSTTPSLSSSSPSSTTLSNCQSSLTKPSDHLQQAVSKVNLIMTDYSMPGMNGYDLLKRIKESSWKDIPVVVMSSENVPSRINKCLEGGAEEFLLKPVKASDLRKLHSHLLMMNTIAHRSCKDNAGAEKTTNSNTKKEGDQMKEIDSNSYSIGMNNNMANKRKANLTTSSDRSRPRVVQELPVS